MNNVSETVEAVMAAVQPTSADPSSVEPMPSNDRPRNPQGRIGNWSSLADCLSERDSAEFRRLVIGLDESHHRKVAALSRWTERWIKAACMAERVPTRWLLFGGQAGTGKSHALKAANTFLRSNGVDLWPRWYPTAPPSVRMATWSKVVQAGPLMWADFEEEVHAAKFVILDDLGSETDRYRTGEPAERLRIILDLCATKWLLASTNLTRETLAKAFDPRVQSRMERAAVLDMTGVPDYRPKLRGAA